MATLRGDENRYLLHVDPADRALARRVPAARWAPELRGYHLPRRDGVILALDRVFGRDGWQYDANVETDVAEVRGREYDAPRERAFARLDGTQLAVQCDIGDRELVKLVPGYRWSPSNRKWYVPGVPLALEMLKAAFGDLLEVDAETVQALELRAIDEQRAVELDRAAARRREEDQERLRASARAEPPERREPPPPEPGPGPTPDRPAAEASLDTPGTATAVIDRLERIDATLQRMEALFARLLETPAAIAGAAARTPPPTTAATPAIDEDEEPAADWRALLQQSKEDPAGAFDQASRLIQTSGAEGTAPLRAVAGVAASQAGRTQQAFDHLSVALAGTGLEPGLARLAGDTFEQLVLGFLNDDLGPAEPIASIADVRRLLRQELHTASGFVDSGISSPQARATLERLVTDEALRRLRPDLADFCRVAHLLSVVRGGGRMVQGLVADVLKEDSLQPDAQALTTMLFANTLLGEASVDDWLGSWPRETDVPPIEQQRLVDSALKILPLVDSEIVAPTALSVLAITVESDDLPLSARHALLNFIPKETGVRTFAEFLAVYRIAATGGRAPWAQYPGWVTIVSGTRLERSAPYLREVFLYDAPNATRTLADALLPALETYGITDPETQLIDLLDLLKASPKADNLLNQLGQLVEDGAFPGASLLTGEQRRTIYRAAFDEARRVRHDHDARTAFQRLVRLLAQEADDSELIALCRGLTNEWKPLRVPATLTLVESLLAKEAPIEDVLDLVAPLLAPPRDDDTEEVFDELAAIADLRSDYREAVDAFVEKYQHHYERHEDRTFPNRRVVIVGGRQSQRVRAQQLFGQWQLQTDWLDSDEAGRGPRLGSLVAGSCDFVVVNTAHIGHSSSGRAESEARSAGKPVIYNASNGLGRLRKAVWEKLLEIEATPAEAGATKRARKTDQLRSLRRR